MYVHAYSSASVYIPRGFMITPRRILHAVGLASVSILRGPISRFSDFECETAEEEDGRRVRSRVS